MLWFTADVDLVFNSQFVHHSLLRQVADENSNVVSFNIIRKKVTFTENDFNLITKLWPTEERLERGMSNVRLRHLILETNRDNKSICPLNYSECGIYTGHEMPRGYT